MESGSLAFEMDSENLCQRCGDYDFEGQVCKTCGAVTDEVYFGSEITFFNNEKGPKFVPYKDKKNTPSLIYGLSVLENLSVKYALPSNMKAETESLLRDIYSSKSLARKQDIGILAGCCLIQVKQKHNQFASMSDLSAKLQCPMKKVYKFSKIVKSFCNESKSYSDRSSRELADVSEEARQISTSEMLKAAVAKAFSTVEDNKDELIRKTTDLTKLAYDCWLLSGRSPEGVITAAGYLCWQSMNPRTKVPLKTFCSRFSLPYNKASPKVCEMKNMLLKLGKKIPSGSDDYVNAKNILFHLNYILENSETLRYDLLTNTYKADEIAKKEFSTFRKVSTVVKETGSGDVVKQRDFKPNVEASDVEISDSEIAKYIRSEKEVNLIRKLKEKYGS